MSLGKVGAFCGCGEGMGCCDCQGFGSMHQQLVPLLWPRSDRGMSGPVPLYPHNPPQGFRGMGAGKTSGQTNYWPLGYHRSYNRPGLPQMTGYMMNQSPMRTLGMNGMRGFGTIELGGGWTLGDLASLSIVALTLMTVMGKVRG